MPLMPGMASLTRLLTNLSLALVGALSLVALAGCPDERKPIPVVNVVVLPDDDAYSVNGQRMGFRQLSEELRTISDNNQRQKRVNARAIVRLSSQAGVNYDRVRRVEEYCNSVGLDKIEKGL